MKRYRDILSDEKNYYWVDNPNELMQTFRDVEVYPSGDRLHFVIAECLIATRPAHPEMVHEVQLILNQATIGAICNGDITVSEPVFKHLTRLGFKPKCYKLTNQQNKI